MHRQARTFGRRTAFGAGLVVTGLVAAACGASASTGGQAAGSAEVPSGAASARGGYGYAAAPAVPAAPARGNTAVRTGSSSLGTILTDTAGRTLYLFEKDGGTTSTCYGACSGAWPPATVSGTAQAGGGALANLVGTTARTDGTTQLTYGGHPLYYFSGDGRPGSVKGQGLRNFGGGWYVVDPHGMKIDND